MIGFIGLGNMGSNMARCLMKHGKKLIVLDTNKSINEKFKAEGCEIAESPADIAAASRHIITMLPRSEHVKEVFTGANGILKNIQRGTVCMECSTTDRHVVMNIAELVKKQNAEFVDAPVFGGFNRAKDGTLTIMVGADSKQVYARGEEILKLMSNKVVHVGKVGSGQGVNVCNNMLAGIQMLACSEAMNLGMSMGLDPKALADIITSSTGYSFQSGEYNAVPGIVGGAPASLGDKPGFAINVMARDLAHSQNASTEVQAPTPLGSVAHQIVMILSQSPEYEQKDVSSIYQSLKKAPGK